MNLRYRGVLYRSQANGPGSRTVLFTQGCAFRCPGCQNEELWPFSGGKLNTPERVLDELLAQPCDGWTITGGEPLAQAGALLPILEGLSREGKGIILFTGHKLGEVSNSLELTMLAALCDVLISGRFVQAEAATHGLRGSYNQSITHLTERYATAGLEHFPHYIEVHADPPVVTGFPGG